MKRFRLKFLLFFIALCAVIINYNYETKVDYDLVRKIHKENLEKSPFKNTKKLSKSERKNLQLPPNPYNERLWELTMDPVLGRPRTENIYQIQDELYIQSLNQIPGVPGENPDMAWVPRGPTNIAGRTNGIMFDPNDGTNKKVFAGGVSGGIFVNDNIDDVNSEWKMVEGVPRNLPVSVLTYDPNDTKIFYAGTGESFTGGDAIGNGLWKSSDAGSTWENIFGGRSNSEQVFKDEINQIEIVTKTGENPINFLQASFGPNLPGLPLNYLENDIVIADPLDACTTLSNTSAINGKIVLIEDGSSSNASGCDYFKKVSEGQTAGAIAVIVYNKDSGATDWTDDLKTMGPGNGDASAIKIPSLFIKASEGKRLKEFIESEKTTVKVVKQSNISSSGIQIVPGMFFINDVVVRDNNGTSELYVAAGSRRWDRVLGTRADDQNTILGSGHDAVYKSIDGGTVWNKIELYNPIDSNNSVHNATVVPMDLELDKDNRLWASSTISPEYSMTGGQWGDNPPKGGGKIYRLNEEGSSATFIRGIKVDRNTNSGMVTYDGRRTEMTFTTDNDLIVLCVAPELSEGYWRVVPRLYKGSIQNWIQGNQTELTKPSDADTGIYDYDFARGQGYYSVSLAAHPSIKDRVYVGGINLFSSNQGGEDWGQLTHSRGRYAEYLHADQHSVIFNKNNPQQLIVGNDGGVGYSSVGGSLEPRNNLFHTAQYYTVAVAPLGMFDNYATKVYGFDPLKGSWDQSANGGDGATVLKLTTTIDGHKDVFAGGMQDNGTSLQADNDNGFSIGNDISGGDGAATMFSQNPNNKYVVYNYVYNNSVEVLNMNNPQNDRSYWYRISSNDDNEGSFINRGALDSNLGVIYQSADTGKVRAYHNWDDFTDRSSIKDTYLIEGLGSDITALTVSQFETQSSTLYAGTSMGQLWKITNAHNPNNQTKVEIQGNEFAGSISDIEFGVDENHIFVTFYNYGVESIHYSSDGGVNWEKKEGNLPDLPVFNILQSPLDNDEVIIGTELGVWFTNNFSSENPTWNQANAGMKDLRVTDMDLRKGDNKVFISTYGLGIYSGEFQNSEPTFTVNSTTKNIEILAGDKKSFDVDYRVYNDFNEEIIFSLEGTPNNTVINYSPAKKYTINSDGKLTIEIEIDDDAELGKYDLKLKAVSTSKSRELEITLRVISDDNDKDGVKNDVDNCPETANADQSDIDGDGIGDVCDSNPLPKDTFSLQSSGETCRSSNDGKMKLDIKRDGLPNDTDVKFTVAVTGGPSGFTHTPEKIEADSWSLSNLEAGTYTVCMTTDFITNFEQCFNVIITQPQDLSVLTSRARGSDIVDITMSGSKSYTILHNNKQIITSDSKFGLELKKGLNIIKVYGEKECQGMYEETIFNSENILLSPNPARTSSKLWIGGDDKNVNVSMFDNAGRMLWTNENNVPSSRSIDIQVSNLRPGLYYVKVDSETVKKTAKLIKE